MGIYIGQQRLNYLWEKIKSIIPTKVSDLTNDSGFTSNVGTITGITMNGASKGTSGVVNLGTVLTEHQDISSKVDSVDLAMVATSGSYNDLIDKPTIPSAVTESTVSGWGFTKNTGTVSSLSDLGITATATELNYTDGVTSNIQTQLNAKGTYSKPSGGIPKTDLATAVQTSIEKADTALQSYTETDPTVPSWAKQSTKPSYTASEVGALPDTYVAPVISVNGQTGAVNLTIPSAVTESTVTGWGFTKNGGTVTSTGGTTAVNNIQVVSELPASPDANTLYLIPES